MKQNFPAAALEQPCKHCHTLFLPTLQESEFCCQGCRYVNQLLIGEGLIDFYTFQDGKTGRPVGERPFQAAQMDWLYPLITKKNADTSSNQKGITLRISGITCVGCVWLIEKLFLSKKGAARISIYPATAEAEFIWTDQGECLLELADKLPRYGYILEDPATSGVKRKESQKLMPRIGICAAFAMNTMAFSLPHYLGMDAGFHYARLFDLIALISTTFAILIGGSYFFKKSFVAISNRSIHIDLPIALGLATAYTGSLVGWVMGERSLIYFDFVCTFIVLMLSGRYLHLASTERAQNQLQGQSALSPETTLSNQSRKSTSSIQAGDELFLHPGQTLPVSSRLISKSAEFSLAWMTGEPETRSYEKGSPIPAGAISVSAQNLTLTAEQNYSESLVTRLTEQDTRAESSPYLQSILQVYLIAVILIGLGGGSYWWFSSSSSIKALQVMISIFVISCPCAIGVAIPLLDRRTSTSLATKGVFIQNSALWAIIPRIKNIIFDKTGTLTLETPSLLNPQALDQIDRQTQSILTTLTSGSLHPLSRTLFQHLASNTQLDLDTKFHVGLGTSLRFEDHTWTLGKPGWCGSENFTNSNQDTLSCELACDGSSVALFNFQESLRPHTVRTLRQLGKKHPLHILSGDQIDRVKSLANELYIPSENAHGALSPDDKKLLVTTLSPSLYLGDGMNDSLAFSAATVSGTPVADRSLLDRRSDFLFTCSSLNFLPKLFELAHWRNQTVRLILAFTIIYNLAAITACLFGRMNPLLAAILMPLSSIISLIIAQRPITKKQKGKPGLKHLPHPRESATAH